MSAVFWLADIASRYPDRPAVVSGRLRLSFADLSVRVDRLARWLSRRGLGPGDCVGLSIEGEVEHLVATLALWRLGCLQVALPTFDPLPMREALAIACGVTVLLADRHDMDLPGTDGLMPDFQALSVDRAVATTLPDVDVDAETVLLSSSGTTGRVKVVALSQRQLLARAPRFWRYAEAEISFPASSIQFNASRRQSLTALACGKATRLGVRDDRRPLP